MEAAITSGSAGMRSNDDRVLARVSRQSEANEDVDRKIKFEETANQNVHTSGSQGIGPFQQRETEIISRVEPFLDVATASLRRDLIDQSVVSRFEQLLTEEFDAGDAEDVLPKLIHMLAEMKADVHYLKAAYIEASRYREPDFAASLPDPAPDRVCPERLTVDMRAEITGGNWYHAEPDGRWAGPENESSVMIPALRAGRYELTVDVVDELEPGTIDGMEILVNGTPVAFTRESPVARTAVRATLSVNDTYKFPFWSVKFRFPKLGSPAKNGSTDDRLLAIRVASVRFVRISG